MYNLALSLINTTKKEFVDTLAKEFNISNREVHKRIRSMFGKSVDDLLTPTKEELTKAILKSDSVEELKNTVGKTTGLATLYDKYYGVSTFASARIKCEQYREITDYNPTKDDNLSILISQKLGDGHLEFNKDEPRYSIHIQHCEKQFDYLVEKVKLINKAYPVTAPVGSIKKFIHKQGHVYYSYRTNNMFNSDIKYVYDTESHKLVKELTPLGMFLLYMDDGSLSQNNQHGTRMLKICNPCPLVRKTLQEFLKSYGIGSTIRDEDMAVGINDVVNISKFLTNFTVPFKKYTPECIKYKTVLMV